MDPAAPVSETDRRNVTLFCDVRDGNPAALVSVRWYFGGELLKQVSEKRERRRNTKRKQRLVRLCRGRASVSGAGIPD